MGGFSLERVGILEVKWKNEMGLLFSMRFWLMGFTSVCMLEFGFISWTIQMVVFVLLAAGESKRGEKKIHNFGIYGN